MVAIVKFERIIFLSCSLKGTSFETKNILDGGHIYILGSSFTFPLLWTCTYFRLEYVWV